jgi:Protein of unknown function (DUF1682)
MRLSTIFLWCVVFTCTGLVSSFEEEDNDFADFEEFEDFAPPEKTEEKPQPPKPKQEDKPFVDQDDAEDGIVEDEFDHFTDNDEFEGFGTASEKPQQGEPKLTMAKIPIHLRGRLDSYWVEILFITGLVVYFINYAIGKNKNIQIANSWFNAHKTFLEDNFALVGDDGKKETEQVSGVLMKESDSIFTLWCSGRVCVEGMLLELKLIKRQDLLSMTMGIMKKQFDQITIKAELSKDAMDTFVLAIASKKSASKLFKEMTDLVSWT